ncbi:MAG: class I SAM-dependent methyltransferase [Chloroflexota bacterium]|nr:class I SAM-dependent methyltransferase [Chloroflexota bacterium]
MANSTQRFSSRVENYVKYRPLYPSEVVALLATECGLTPDALVADIGAGTGLLAELFLKHGNRVFGVEPNREMRVAGERLLTDYRQYTSIDGTAEATTLDDQSVEIITAGQAFHWFDRTKARAEFARILRPSGWVALVWNERRVGSTPFLQAYEQLLRSYSSEYETLNHRQIDQATIAAFFEPGTFTLQSFTNTQIFDFEGVKGRLLSSSYTPEPGQPTYQPMLDELKAIFQQFQVDDTVAFEYDTNVYYGQL